MKATQKDRVQFGVTWAVEHIQEIEVGAHEPKKKLQQIDHQLLMLLDDVVEALPQALRKQARACLDARKRVDQAHMDEIDVYLASVEEYLAAFRAQKETSPVCLAASDSF